MTQTLTIEQMMIAGVIHSSQFSRTALNHILPEYFEDANNRRAFEITKQYIDEYQKIPSLSALNVDLESRKDMTSDDAFDATQDTLKRVFSEDAKKEIFELSHEWLVDKAETYCQNRAVYLRVMDSISILDGSDKKHTKDAIPDMMKEALGVKFNISLGHNYLKESELRWQEYHRKEAKVPTFLEMLNYVTNGGCRKQSLCVFLAPTGGCKTIFLCNIAQHALFSGLNVVYFSMEMDKYQISKRIDAKTLDIPVADVDKSDPKAYERKFAGLREQTQGSLFVENYATKSKSVADYQQFIEDVQSREGIKIDLIVVDYLGIVKSKKMKSDVKSYEYFKSVAEEMRELAWQFDCPVWTAGQGNRSAQGASDFDLTEMAESHGISQTADLIIGGISGEELEKLNQLRIKQLKNRWGDPNRPRSWLIENDRSRMTMRDLDLPTHLPKTETIEPTENNAIPFADNKVNTKPKKSRLSGINIE